MKKSPKDLIVELETVHNDYRQVIMNSSATSEEKMQIMRLLQKILNIRAELDAELMSKIEDISLQVKAIDFDRSCLNRELQQRRKNEE